LIFFWVCGLILFEAKYFCSGVVKVMKMMNVRRKKKEMRMKNEKGCVIVLRVVVLLS